MFVLLDCRTKNIIFSLLGMTFVWIRAAVQLTTKRAQQMFNVPLYLSIMHMCTYLLERAKEKITMKTKQDKNKTHNQRRWVPFYTRECMNGNSMRVDYPVRAATV